MRVVLQLLVLSENRPGGANLLLKAQSGETVVLRPLPMPSTGFGLGNHWVTGEAVIPFPRV